MRILIGLGFLGALAAAFAAGVLVTIKRDGKETHIEVPEESTTRIVAIGVDSRRAFFGHFDMRFFAVSLDRDENAGGKGCRQGAEKAQTDQDSHQDGTTERWRGSPHANPLPEETAEKGMLA